jgi:hypothetical protein
MRARLEQAGTVRVEALLSTSDLASAPNVVHWDRGLRRRATSSMRDCVRLEPRAPNCMPVSIMEQIEVRLEPDSRGFTIGRPA